MNYNYKLINGDIISSKSLAGELATYFFIKEGTVVSGGLIYKANEIKIPVQNVVFSWQGSDKK